MKKALFIDRDGTLIVEPPVDYQVDSLHKLKFVPGAIGALRSLSGLGYRFVLATNQDGLGTAGFPRSDFEPPHRMMIETFAGEGVTFYDELIDDSFEHEGKDTRKPGVGMFAAYTGGDYDLAASYVIGDRLTDVQLAANLGTKAMLFQPEDRGAAMLAGSGLTADLVSDDWYAVAEYIRKGERTATVSRRTAETEIELYIDIDGRGESSVATGLGFLDHMLMQVVHHASFTLRLTASGDLHVDEHHTVEDVAIVLGEAVGKAIGDKRGMERYGFALPMDDCAATVLLDFGGRIEFVWDATFTRERVGDVPTEMFRHFFKSFSEAARCNLHISASGENEHHKIEGIFKAFSRAMKNAVRRDPFSYELPSSKGVL